MTAKRTVAADAAQLTVLNQLLQEFWTAAALAPAVLRTFELALEEIFVNIVVHGTGPGSTPLVEVSLSWAAPSVVMTVEDDGPPFDPLSVPPPDVTAGLADRRVGGLGVFLVRKTMDTVSYTRSAGRNQLRIAKRLDGCDRPRAAGGKSA